ncbi:cAMP-dependent protein kinase catalytic subunit PRKX [Anopheles ziemanni]|uniref:cAMP-dependent protein kinase catalytic subunit PRKX n=1 Tax=Anopheles coustani TaxID=139045 RepID=UPI002657B2CA|nr:cAMP-dependent protein kinase catalytic subunit PRKX [Anopheles coustani]XP_058175014.1 cAMP-dependent protein kinase catalytic subunit PRKX [Anopheles ziemanni]
MSSSPRLTGYTLRPSETSTTVSITLNSCGTGIKKLSIKSAGSTNSGGESTDPLESDFSGEEEEEQEVSGEEEADEEEDEDSARKDRRKGESVRSRLATGHNKNTKAKAEEKDEEEEEEEEEAESNSDNEQDIRHSTAAKLVSNRRQKSASSADDDDDEDDNEEDEDEDEPEQRNQGQQVHRNVPGSRQQPRTPSADADDGDDSRCGGDSDDDGGDLSDKNNNIGGAVRRKQPEDYALDDFQILKTIGTGTFGRVCLCRDKITNKYWAMKILAMADVIRLKQIEHVKNEKNILKEIDHPFIVNMRWNSKDDCCLYMLFEFVSGGELFSYLRNAGRFDSATANFYACEIVLALEYLHSLSIVYRDLKPENLLLDRDGHLKITDFGFAKKLKDRTWTLCGTPEYLAPEIIQSKGHNKAVDWWALGVLIYEMVVGYPPFYDDNPFGIYEKILSGKIEWSRHVDPIAKDLVKKLLVLDRTKRLGNMKNGAEDVKRHRWFKQLDWNVVIRKQLKPPIVPTYVFNSKEDDTSNFDDYPETDWKSVRSLDKIEMQLFEDF